jgi:hypothetical protein
VIPPDFFAAQFYLVVGVFLAIHNLENLKKNRPAIGAN